MWPMLIQILRCLKQPNLWRFVFFASYAIGLLSFAFSSSFTSFFGKRTLLKVFLFIIVNSIICLPALLYLFANRRQDSTRSWLGVNFSYLVLIITSAYSFFFDKKTQGSKPDAYILLSVVSFAIASLGLSRQIYYGFVVDLLSFFCGSLIILLMKIKVWFFFVGACFSCFLINLRAYLELDPFELDAIPVSQRVLLSSSDVPVNHVPFFQVHSDSEETNTGAAIQVDADTDNTNDTVSAFEENSLAQEGNSDSVVIMLQFMDCIEALRKENRQLIITVAQYVDKLYRDKDTYDYNEEIPVDVNLVVDALPSGLIDNLHEKVKLMVEAGFEEQCCHEYSNWRGAFLGEYLSKFGFQKEKLLKGKIRSWFQNLAVAMKILFPNERRLLDLVFEGLPSLAVISLGKVCMQTMMPLLSFVNTLVMMNHSLKERLPNTSDTDFDSHFFVSSNINYHSEFYGPLCECLQDFELMLKDEDSVLSSEVFVLWRTLLLKFDIIECFINYDASSQRGIEEVMDKLLVYYQQNIGDWVEHQSLLSDHSTWLIDTLERFLEVKTEGMTPAKRYVYTMNPLNHMKSIAKKLKLKAVLGNDWFAKINAQVQQKLELYQTSSWNPLLDILKLDSSESMEPSLDVVAESMKGKLESFNQQFKETCQEQSKWYIWDDELREQIIKSLEKILLPAYAKFINRIRDVLDNDADQYITKCDTFDISNQLKGLFLKGERQRYLRTLLSQLT